MHKGSLASFRVARWNKGLLTSHCRGIGPHVALRGEISWFFSSCSRKLGVSLELQRGPQGPARVASEKSALFQSCDGHVVIVLESLPVNSTVSRVQSVNSAVLSSSDRDLRLPLKVQLGSQASSGVEAQN